MGRWLVPDRRPACRIVHGILGVSMIAATAKTWALSATREPKRSSQSPVFGVTKASQYFWRAWPLLGISVPRQLEKNIRSRYRRHGRINNSLTLARVSGAALGLHAETYACGS